MKTNKINFQIVTNNRELSKDFQFIRSIYLYEIKYIEDINKYTDSLTNIYIKDDMSEEILIGEQDKQMIRAIFISLDTKNYSSMSQSKRQKLLNDITFFAFSELFRKLNISILILQDVYERIIKQNYSYMLPVKKLHLKKKFLEARVMALVNIEKYTYLLKFININTKEIKTVEFFQSWSGCPMFGKFEKIKWGQEVDEIIILDKYEEIETIVNINGNVDWHYFPKIHTLDQIIENNNINKFGTLDEDVVKFSISGKMYF